MEVKELHSEMQKTWTEFKSVMERQDAEIKQNGQASAETKQQIEHINEALNRIELEQKRAATAPTAGPRETAADLEQKDVQERKAAFLEWARKGKEGLGPEQVKKLTVSDDTTGGFLAPKEYVREIIKGIVETSPVRSLARVRTTSQRSVQMPKRTGTFAAQWVSESGTRSETTGLTYGLEEVANHELYALVDISFQDLEDSAFDLEGELRMEFAEQFGKAEATAFVSGNAVGKPEGFLTQSDVSEVVSGDATLVKPDGLIALFYALKSGYVANSSWIMNRQTIKAVRQLKDTTNQYLWQPSMQLGEPATLLGRPIVEAVDMPDVGAGTYPIAFGDFRRAYVIVDRLAISILRDPLTQATSGAVRFIARKRVGGQVVLPEAIKKQKIST